MDIHPLTRIFCQIDDFCNELDSYLDGKLLTFPIEMPHKRGPECSLSNSEIMTILIFFQSSGYRNFKTFYIHFLQKFFHKAFPTLPSYNRFIQIMKRVALPLILFSKLHSGKRTGIYYIDSTCLPTCHLKRSKRYNTFDNIAQYTKTSVGWFFGLKLHIVINHQGELIAFKLTQGNRHDAKAGEPLLKTLQGLAFGDKAYLGKQLASELLKKGLKLITKVRKNMKRKKLTTLEKQLLNKRGIIETVIHHLKHHYHVWHTRHRSVFNAMTHLMAALAAYVIEPLKISSIRLLGSNNFLTETQT